MQSHFPVLLVDDGELEDVRELLDELGAEFAHLRGGAVPARIDPPRDLFVTTARRAPIARDWSPATIALSGPVKIVVVTEDSESARTLLRQMGYDYLVRRPVHPMALRLLILRALYRGEERRGEPRVAVGYEVRLRSGLRRRSALLADLSMRGCRILAQRRIEPGTSISLQLPAEIAGGRNLSLRGRVIRSDAAEGSAPSVSVAIEFERVEMATHGRLVETVRERTLGPATLGQAPGGSHAPTAPLRGLRRSVAPKRPRQGREPERRRRRRGRYARPVVALAGDARQVLLGRDLSSEGMRVDSSPDLALGSRLRLAIYGGAREEPFLIDATVSRNDGDRGVALRFERLEAEVAERLEQLVAGLPAVESLRDGETGALGTVLSRIVSR